MIEEKDLQWLVRDVSNVISGPYSHHEVLQLIKKGQIRGKTEVSRSNSYWFSLEEKAELARFFPELGLKAPEASVEMTATLNQADHGVENTQFVATPSREELADPKPAEQTPGKAQWLSEDFADEFGLEDGLTDISIQTSTNVNEVPAPEQQSAGYRELELEKTKLTADDLARQEMMKRASVKADTLPSEFKDYEGERPKPINSMIKGPERSSALPTASNVVQVPVNDHESHAKILPEEGQGASERRGGRRGLWVALAGIALVGGGLYAGVTLSQRGTRVPKASEKASAVDPETAVKKSLLLFDLEGAKDAVAELELDPATKGKVTLPVAQAMVKKEFLYDADGAIMSLQSAESFAEGKQARAEVENLTATYRFERDREAALEGFQRLTAAFPGEPVFRYNLALALVRSGRIPEGLRSLGGLSVPKGDPLAEDIAVLAAWARDLASKGTDSAAEAGYLRALDANPQSPKARLGLAIFRFRKAGLRESEADFRAFLDNLPELDPPTRVPNFRKLSDFDFYNFARSQIRDLNIPLGAAGTRPSPLVMAVDAVLSCLQSRTGEAGKILELALSAAPGDQNLLKAVGYHRWKEGRHQEIIDLLKDAPADRNSFGLNLLLGKAYAKTGRRDLAEKHYESLTIASPKRSEGWALLGEMQLRQGRGEEARRNLEAALERDPLDIVALRGLDQLGQSGLFTPAVTKNLPF